MAKDKKTRLLEELIKDPATATGRGDELKKFGLDPAKIAPSAKAAKEILEDPDAAERSAQFSGLEFPVKLALLDLLAEEGAGAFLARLQRDEKDKGVAKAIGKALHSVRAQGQNVADMREKKSVKFDFGAEGGQPDSYVSPLDTEGNRLVLLARMTPQGRMNVFHVVVGDTQGISNFEGLALTRAAYRKFVGMAEAQMGVPLAKVPGDYAAWVVAEGARLAIAAGLPTPPAYEQAKASIEPPASAPEHPLHAFLKREEVEKAARDLVGESAKLHQFPECAFWVPDEATLETLQERIKEADESKIAVTEAQKQDLRMAAAKKTAVEYFADKAKRELWEKRLKETALVLASSGRLDDARLAWATGIELAKGGDVEKIPFATEMTEKIVKHAGELDPHAGHDHGPGEHGHGISAAMREAANEPEAQSPIIKP